MKDFKVPDIDIPAAGAKGEYVNLSKAAAFVIYFYPKDATPGCAAQGREFSRLYKNFLSAGFEVYGVSKDSIKSHIKFKDSEKFPFPLLSDSDGALCGAFQTLKEKIHFGKKHIGIERSAFALKDGKILKEARHVQGIGHVQELLEFIQNL